MTPLWGVSETSDRGRTLTGFFSSDDSRLHCSACHTSLYTYDTHVNHTPRLSMLILLGVTLSIGPEHRLGHVPLRPPQRQTPRGAFGRIKHPGRSRRSTHRYIHIHSDIELAPRGRRHRVERKRGAVTRFDRNESVTFTNPPPKFPPELQLAPRIHEPRRHVLPEGGRGAENDKRVPCPRALSGHTHFVPSVSKDFISSPERVLTVLMSMMTICTAGGYLFMIAVAESPGPSFARHPQHYST